jgi:hypothetical protein
MYYFIHLYSLNIMENTFGQSIRRLCISPILLTIGINQSHLGNPSAYGTWILLELREEELLKSSRSL